MKCLEKDAANRYQTSRELRKDLEGRKPAQVLKERKQKMPAAAKPAAPSHRRRLTKAVIILLAVAALSLIGYSTYRRNMPIPSGDEQTGERAGLPSEHGEGIMAKDLPGGAT